MLTSNNYLGFANHPRIREAQKKAVDRWGAGLGSVRFICGTQELHKELEAEIASFFGRRRRDPLHDLLGRERGPLRRGPRRAGRPLLRRAQPRLDHRRRPAVEGEAVPRAPRRPRRAREDARRGQRRRATSSTSPTASSRWRARRRTCASASGSARRTARSSPSTTRTRPGSSGRPGAARPRSRASPAGSRSRPARSARRWARRPAASSRGRRRSSTRSASGAARISSPTRCRRRSPPGRSSRSAC